MCSNKPDPSNHIHAKVELPEELDAQTMTIAGNATIEKNFSDHGEYEFTMSSSSVNEPYGRDGSTETCLDLSRRDYTNDNDPEPPIEHPPLLPFGANLGQVNCNGDGFGTKAEVSDEGRLNNNIDRNLTSFPIS